MLRLSACCIDQLMHVVTHWAPEGVDPAAARLVVTEADCLLADPTLDELDEAVLSSSAASTTSILPPNWNSLVLTMLLFLTKEAVSH